MKKRYLFMMIIYFSLFLIIACTNNKVVDETEKGVLRDSLTPKAADLENSDQSLPLLAFDINKIEFIVDGFNNLVFTTKKQSVIIPEDAAEYAIKLMREYFTSVEENIENYQPIAILHDEPHKAWGVSFKKKTLKSSNEVIIGDAYNITFYEEDGNIIAIWKDE